MSPGRISMRPIISSSVSAADSVALASNAASASSAPPQQPAYLLQLLLRHQVSPGILLRQPGSSMFQGRVINDEVGR